jgi:hypothetical protein
MCRRALLLAIGYWLLAIGYSLFRPIAQAQSYRTEGLARCLFSLPTDHHLPRSLQSA